MTSIRDLAAENVAEIEAIVAAFDDDAALRVAQAVLDAQTVFFYASGRSLLALKSVAMRLMHIGFEVRVAGEVVTPAPAAGDLLIVASARGGDAAVRAIATARAVGAGVVAITTHADSLADADVQLVLPARSAVPTAQHAGSLFEQSVLVVGDAIARSLQVARGVITAELDARHATL